jgi:hypothetical protein
MSTSNTDFSCLRQEHECSERRNRFWRTGSLACLLLVGLTALIPANQEAAAPNVVAAHRFELKDEAGKVRAALFLNDVKQPALCLYDERGLERLNVRIVDGPEFWMFDENGNSRVAFRGINREPELVFFNKDTNKVMTRVTVTDKGGAFAAWTPKNQSIFGADSTGTVVRQAFQLIDENSKVRAQIAKAPTTNAYFKLLDENGAGRILMFVGEHGENASTLSFYDADGQTSLLNVGAQHGQTGYIYGSTPGKQGAFLINNTGIAAKNFERR